ncbi:trypsin-like peptidase domain-containing protein [Vibrio parahaemolyticus]|uniref:trypsin-like peptidase domain-containing protein n=1 Tax=Vibrio parahaemolyticus TaxID=670 RepID=UPI0003FA25AC|nr:trypsin-like peptidase domain-containing protein [Vibrio parahaemolyticus]EGR1752549.1 serine protease [Vibrio parahaemolyticus]EME0905748.1 trypsin-like peptidase domain-containing protein [Vibrio parahaemolyticus]MDF4667194.1 trypsin-like peptidase domain-containing protein [Vibrio parahaemolyticus]HCE1619845.1 trypsin-like peptidase domain-containing protein [Vibrio parahaemolyticus]HCG5564162.1 trypsin-like peptidase domain-containing protein [Vibrio parahaemolyticus]
MAVLPKGCLAFPVLITLGSGGLGTGFFVLDGQDVFLVTAKHVLFNNANLLQSGTATIKSYTEDQLPNDYWSFHVDLNQVNQTGNLRYLVYKDVCAIRTHSGNQLVPGVIQTHAASKQLMGIALGPQTKPISSVEVSSDVFVFGYPASIGIKSNPYMTQFSMDTPLLRKGVVAGIAHNNDTIILDCPVYKGNSGGPVIGLEPDGTFNLIGIVSQFVPVEDSWRNESFGLVNVQWSNSGYSIAEPYDAVQSVINLFYLAIP